MYIKNIYLENFRGYPKKRVDFEDGVTLVVGPNTSGKSNLLEAIFLLAFGKSPRADLDREMLRGEEKLGFVRATVLESDPFDITQGRPAHSTGSGHSERESKSERSRMGDNRDLEVVLTETGKRFRVNGVGRRLSDFSQHFHVVLFSPEDLNLVIGSPDLRRRFLDFALGSVDSCYARALTEFDQVRKRRNRLLERINRGEALPTGRQALPTGRQASDAELGFWDAKFLETGVLIQDKRREFFDEINRDLRTENLELSYLLSGLTAERLLACRRQEIAAETSLIGPHRDNFSFLKNEPINRLQLSASEVARFAKRAVQSEPIDLASYGSRGEPRKTRDLSVFGSRGEQRRAVLVLKKAELEFVEKRIGNRPVLLLDDIFSELDEENRARVFDLIGEGHGPRSSKSGVGPARNASASVAGGQTIITTTDLHHVPQELQKDLQIINL